MPISIKTGLRPFVDVRNDVGHISFFADGSECEMFVIQSNNGCGPCTFSIVELQQVKELFDSFFNQF